LIGYVALCYVGLRYDNKEAQLFALAGVEVLPFLVLALLASLGIHKPWARVLTLVYWLGLVGVIGLFAVAFTCMAVMQPAFAAQIKNPVPGATPGKMLLPGGGIQILLTFLGVFLAVPLGLLGYVPAVRRVFVQVRPFEETSFVHATALATVLAITLICFFPLIVLQAPPLLLWMEHIKDTPLVEEMSRQDNLHGELYGLIWLVPVALLAAGYPLRRGLRETLKRVGLVRPRGWQVAWGILAAANLVLLMTGLDHKIGDLWERLGWPETDAKVFNDLMKFAINPLGAVVIGVTAGLGEELAVRGVLQPRLGILLSNLFFTSLHAFQYNFDGLLSVFLIGLILGVIRKYTNTTTSALVHGLYDFVLVLFTYLNVEGF
jgi:membrane protease YdiL (CAAX protease family)